MKFPIKDFSVNVSKSSGNCGFGPIYRRILNGELHFLCSDTYLFIQSVSFLLKTVKEKVWSYNDSHPFIQFST